MKTNKTYSIDVEIAQKLENEDNASALIEKLLRDHYSFDAGKKKSDAEQVLDAQGILEASAGVEA